jgi:ABC-type Fe3+ transport system permease subunit
MVYTFLPFTILPIYAAAEKFDFRLVEAARDLGARPFQAFRKVFLPGIRRGVLTAVLVVFIPALGSYIIPDLVGGPGSEMLGNKIAQRVFTDRNLPHAAALSAVLVLAVLAPLVAVLALQAVITEAAGNGVTTRATPGRIVTITCCYQVITSAPVDQVIATFACDAVNAGVARQRLILVCSDKQKIVGGRIIQVV